MEALFNIEPNKPMRFLEDVNDQFAWPKNWNLSDR
jgi:hypothetical protein